MNKSRDRQEPTNNNNNIFPHSSLPPLLPPGPGPFTPPPTPLFQSPLSVFNSFQSPPPRPDNYFGNFHIPAQLLSGNFGNRD